MKTAAIALISSLTLLSSAYADDLTYTQINNPAITCSDTHDSHICSMLSGTNMLPVVNDNVGNYDTTQNVFSMRWNSKLPTINVQFDGQTGKKQKCIYTNMQTDAIHAVPLTLCSQPDNTPYTIFMLYDITLQAVAPLQQIVAHSITLTVHADLLFSSGSATLKEKNADFAVAS